MADVPMPANRPKPGDFATNRLLATFPAELRDLLDESAQLYPRRLHASGIILSIAATLF